MNLTVPSASKVTVCFAEEDVRLDVYSDRTVPFSNANQRAKHFLKHQHEFACINEFDYERLADWFMSLSLASNPSLHECINPTGMNDRNRLDAVTRYFGVAYGVMIIHTLHTRSIAQIAARGGPQGFVNYQCSKVYP